MERIDCVVIGAGVDWAAVARALAIAGREVVIVEKAERIGAETSSRNSEVIHAGLYYDRSSLMARFCVEGRRALYDYCCRARRRPCALRQADRRDLESGTAQLGPSGRARRRTASAICSSERGGGPRAGAGATCEGALLSPSTGIIDSHGYMLALLGDAEARGASWR